MEPIVIRYGEDVTLPIDTGNTTDVSADIYIGKPGQVYVLTGNATLTNGEGVFTFTRVQTRIPLGTYNYQINVTDISGKVSKYPTADGCDECELDFPELIVCEALDETEVS